MESQLFSFQNVGQYNASQVFRSIGYVFKLLFSVEKTIKHVLLGKNISTKGCTAICSGFCSGLNVQRKQKCLLSLLQNTAA